jgi:aspartyl aminopeptidase
MINACDKNFKYLNRQEIIMDSKKYSEELLQFIAKATSPFHTIISAKEELDKAGFIPLDVTKSWKLEKGKAYYAEYYGTSLIAFKIGENYEWKDGIRISAAHGDVPGIRIKSKPEVISEKSAQLNVEIYGGVILNTWLDRPLSAAGRVTIKSDHIFRPETRYVDFKRPLLTIPNLAIHFNRDTNKGVELNRQTDMLPMAGMIESMLEKEQFFMKCLAKELGVEVEQILDYELNLYNLDTGCRIGIEEDLISSPRLDDLTSVQALLTGIIEGTAKQGLHVMAIFDHEEIGSKSKQGAGSAMLSLVIQKIISSLGGAQDTYLNSLENSLMLSVDVAHGIHPNKAIKSDITNKAYLNGGVCIKAACSQAYATDSEAIGIIQQICEHEGIAYQKVMNRSDVVGGGTLGSIASALLPVRTVDLGVPVLAMHSSRELMGAEDQTHLVHLLKAFYSL